MKHMKRMLAVVLTCAMILSMLTLSVFAAESTFDYTIRYEDEYGKELHPSVNGKWNGDGASVSVLSPMIHGYALKNDDDTIVTFDKLLVDDVTKTATYTVVYCQPDYCILYDANGGSMTEIEQFKAHDETVILTAENPFRSGYRFLGWAEYADASAAVFQAGDAWKENRSVTLYAIWEKIPGSYAVIYDANGGTDAPEIQIKNEGESVAIAPTAPTREGYLFLGWSKSKNGTEVQYRPNDLYTTDASLYLYAVWMPENLIDCDFSVSNLTVDTVSVLQRETVNVSFRLDSWNPTASYEKIPVSILLCGRVVYETEVSFSAYGGQTVKLALNIGDTVGIQTLEVQINSALCGIETNSANNFVSTTFEVLSRMDLSVEAIIPNASYVAGNEVITSFLVTNHAASDLLPDDAVDFIFTVYGIDLVGNYYTVEQQTWEKVVVPSGESNLVYFKWRVPAEADGITYRCEGIINPASKGNEKTYVDNTSSFTTLILKSSISETANERYTQTAPEGYCPNTAVPETLAGRATWTVWEYTDEEGFVLKTYGIGANTASPKIRPDSACEAATFDGEKWIMKSGYGITLIIDGNLYEIEGALMPDSAAYTQAQNVYATLQEYGYVTEDGQYRTLYGEDGIYGFASNATADSGAKLHFIPSYITEGEYTVSVTVCEIWTPAGMLTVVRNSNSVVIDGNIYEDM